MVQASTPKSLPVKLSDLTYVDRSLAIACTRGREAIVTRFRHILHRENLSEQQWRVLRILYDMGDLTSAEISQHSCIHKVSISRIIKSLEERQFVERCSSAVDARASYVSLTKQGRKTLAPLIEEATHIHVSIANDLGHERYAKLLELLTELARIND